MADLLNDLAQSSRALIDAYGGDVPDWLEEEVGAVENVLEKIEGKAPVSDLMDVNDREATRIVRLICKAYMAGDADDTLAALLRQELPKKAPRTG